MKESPKTEMVSGVCVDQVQSSIVCVDLVVLCLTCHVDVGSMGMSSYISTFSVQTVDMGLFFYDKSLNRVSINHSILCR